MHHWHPHRALANSSLHTTAFAPRCRAISAGKGLMNGGKSVRLPAHLPKATWESMHNGDWLPHDGIEGTKEGRL
jgi:hypothetical protein